MVMTMLEARVAPEKAGALQAAYHKGTESLVPGMVRAYLVHSSTDPELWRMMAVWNSGEVVERMRKSGEVPPGVLMFRAAGAEPQMSVFDVVAQRQE